MSVLLLIAAIATFACWLAGTLAIKRKYAADFQAHSAKFTSALSVVYLGCEVLRKMKTMTQQDCVFALKTIISWSSTECARPNREAI